MKVVRKGTLVDGILHKSRSATCHSVFQNSLNIQVGHALLHVGIEGMPVIPFGIQVSASDFRLIKEDMEHKSSMQVKSYGVYIGNRLLCTEEATLIDLSLDLPNIRYEAERFHDILSCFSPFLTETGLPFDDVLRQQNQLSDVFTLCIGRGEGLTPSGDDFIVGMLAVHHIIPFISCTEITTLNHLIQQDITTDVSIAYLQAGLQGLFSSSVKNVMDSLYSVTLRDALNQLSVSGHTSGRDTIAGIYYGLQQASQLLEELYYE